MVRKKVSILFVLVILGACASKMTNQIAEFRDHFYGSRFDKAREVLDKSELKKSKKSQLLWHLENGTLELSRQNEDQAILDFQAAIALIDELYTKKISAKITTFLINDSTDVFYGASYERSFAHYFLARSYYAKYLKTLLSQDLQGARAAILAWDSYFSELQRSASIKTIYQTDLLLKIFGAQIHEVSEVRNDLQISLQLYKDGLTILETMGGAFSVFNKNSKAFIKAYEESLASELKAPQDLYEPTPAYHDLKNFLHYKILSLTKNLRPGEFDQLAKSLKIDEAISKKAKSSNPGTVIVLEEGLIPEKKGKVFDFGLKGAMNSVESNSAKNFIATVGAEILTIFAMEKLGLTPNKFETASSFVFAHDMTRVAVTEAAIQFELPMIDNSKPLERLALFVMNDKNEIIHKDSFPIVSENADIAKLVLEEDIVSLYTRTGTRLAVKHILAIIAAMGVYNSLKDQGEFLAKTAAMATYVGGSKGIAAMEKADTRHWTTLPLGLRMSEIALSPGTYSIGVAPFNDQIPDKALKKLGMIEVKKSGKSIHVFKLLNN